MWAPRTVYRFGSLGLLAVWSQGGLPQRLHTPLTWQRLSWKLEVYASRRLGNWRHAELQGQWGRLGVGYAVRFQFAIKPSTSKSGGMCSNRCRKGPL